MKSQVGLIIPYMMQSTMGNEASSNVPSYSVNAMKESFGDSVHVGLRQPFRRGDTQLPGIHTRIYAPVSARCLLKL